MWWWIIGGAAAYLLLRKPAAPVTGGAVTPPATVPPVTVTPDCFYGDTNPNGQAAVDYILCVMRKRYPEEKYVLGHNIIFSNNQWCLVINGKIVARADTVLGLNVAPVDPTYL